jgi:hypothetical protein
VAVCHLCLNLAAGRTENPVDPPDILARTTKELISSAVQKQSDVMATLATSLNSAAAARYMGSANRVVEHATGRMVVWRAARLGLVKLYGQQGV